MKVGILHPGQMGASIGAALASAGHRVLWASGGRSAATAERAREFTDVGDDLAAESEVIFSICPPDAARDVARGVRGFGGTFVDANAISPRTAREVGELASASEFVDGGIVGPPARAPGTTRLYLSGEGAKRVASLFDGTVLEAIAMDGGPGAASALKMCFAAYTKGTAALLLAIRALAGAEDVDESLVAEWSRSIPELPARSQASAAAAAKAWRFEGEMDEIAQSFEDAGLPGGFHRAAAEIYRRLEEFKDAPAAFDEVLAALLRS